MKLRITFALCTLISVEVVANTVEEMIITDVYRAQQDTPVTFQNLDRTFLEKHPALQEPSFLLHKTPSVTAYSDSGSHNGYSYFRLRGMDQTRINITLDGVPLNEPEDQGAYFSNYPGVWDSLDSVQVQRGVGMSQNGTASYAGSLQLGSVDLTRPARKNIHIGVGSFNTLSGSAEYLSGLQNKKSGYVRVSGVQSDGYKYHSGNESYSILSSGVLRDDSGEWKLLAFAGKQYNELAWLGVTEEMLANDRRTNSNADSEHDEFQQALIYLARDQYLTSNLSLQTTIYYNTLNGNYDFDLNNFLSITEDGELYNYAFDSDFSGVFSTLHYEDDSARVLAGVHLNQYSREHHGSEATAGELYKNTGYKDNYAGFIKSSYSVGVATFFTDIEYRHTDFDYRGAVDIEKIDWSFWNPRAGFSIALVDDLVAYYGIGKTSREPTRNDLFGGSDNLELDLNGDPALFIVTPERVINHEMGIRYSHQQLATSVNIFYMDFEDEITLNGNLGPNGLLLTQDVDSSVRRGVESTVNYQLSNSMAFSMNAALNDSEVKNEGQAFQPVLSPEWIINTGIYYQRNRFDFGLESRYQSASYLNFANTAKLDSSLVFNVQAGYRFETIEWRLHINNVLDRDYSASGVMDINNTPAYFVGAPINVLASMKIKL